MEEYEIRNRIEQQRQHEKRQNELLAQQSEQIARQNELASQSVELLAEQNAAIEKQQALATFNANRQNALIQESNQIQQALLDQRVSQWQQEKRWLTFKEAADAGRHKESIATMLAVGQQATEDARRQRIDNILLFRNDLQDPDALCASIESEIKSFDYNVFSNEYVIRLAGKYKKVTGSCPEGVKNFLNDAYKVCAKSAFRQAQEVDRSSLQFSKESLVIIRDIYFGLCETEIVYENANDIAILYWMLDKKVEESDYGQTAEEAFRFANKVDRSGLDACKKQLTDIRNRYFALCEKEIVYENASDVTILCWMLDKKIEESDYRRTAERGLEPDIANVVFTNTCGDFDFSLVRFSDNFLNAGAKNKDLR